MSDGRPDPRLTGRIGGLTSWSRHDAETLVGPAHRGFRHRFERLVDPEGRLDPHERAVRADRARRAHMLALAARSAEARARKKADREVSDPRPALEARRAAGEPRSA